MRSPFLKRTDFGIVLRTYPMDRDHRYPRSNGCLNKIHTTKHDHSMSNEAIREELSSQEANRAGPPRKNQRPITKERLKGNGVDACQ
jgi:hypothetical protein